MAWSNDLRPEDHEMMEAKDIQFRLKGVPINNLTIYAMSCCLEDARIFWWRLDERC